MKYAILRHRKEWDADWPESVKPNVSLPETFQVNDHPAIGKGPQLPILPRMWDYIRAINDDVGYKYARSIGAMWINKQYNPDDPADTPMAESIRCSHNFVRIIGEDGGSFQIAAFPHTEDLFAHFDPAKHNWYTMPDMFWKAIAASTENNHINPLKGANCFLPSLTKVEKDGTVNPLFVPKSRVEVLPDPPLRVTITVPVLNVRQLPSTHPDVAVIDHFVEGEEAVVFEYKLRGACVWGLTYKGWIALLYSVVPGQRQFFTSWKLDTLGVIPPVPYVEPVPSGTPVPPPVPPPPAPFKRRMKYMDVTWVIDEAGNTTTKRIE